MPDHEIDVERDPYPPPKLVGVKQRRDIKTLRGKERLNDSDALRRQILLGAGDPTAQLCKRLPRSLEYESLKAEAVR